ncbi:MAG: hypothetical protein ABIP39_13325 [Polyangiaceae bacterium]
MVLNFSKIAAFTAAALLSTVSVFAGSGGEACANDSDCGSKAICHQQLSMRSDGNFEAVSACRAPRSIASLE